MRGKGWVSFAICRTVESQREVPPVCGQHNQVYGEGEHQDVTDSSWMKSRGIRRDVMRYDTRRTGHICRLLLGRAYFILQPLCLPSRRRDLFLYLDR